VAEVAQKIGKVAPKLRTALHTFGWSFGGWYFGKFWKYCGRSKVPICPNISLKWKIISAKNKMSQSCAKVALHGKNWAVAQKSESCTKLRSATSNFQVGLHNISWFLRRH